MHLLEAYSNNVGVKLPKAGTPPVESFFPVPEKYITIHPSSSSPIRIYDYFLEALSWIKPYLDKENIQIVQVGHTSDNQLGMGIDYRNCTFSQTCFVLKNSLLHIGCDSVWTHVAGLYNVPSITLFGATLSAVTGPYYKHPKSIVLESHRNQQKASLSVSEPIKTVNLIKPEEIINSVCNILDIKLEFKIDTKYMGSNFHNLVLEVLPEEPLSFPLSRQSVLTIRLDRAYNPQNAYNILNNFKCNIVTKQPVPIELFQTGNVLSVFYEVDSIADMRRDFIKFMHKKAIPYQIITSAKDKELNDIKFRLFDFNPPLIKKTYTPLELGAGLDFKCSKLLICGSKTYLSYWHYLNKREKINENFSDKLPDTSDLTLWENMDNMYIYNYETL